MKRVGLGVGGAMAILIAVGCGGSSSPKGDAGQDGAPTGFGGYGGGAAGSGGNTTGTGGSSGVGTGGSTGSGGTTPGSGGSGSDASADGGGADAPAPGCFVRVVPVSVPSLNGVEGGPTAVLRVRGEAVRPGGALTPTWTWRVQFQGSESITTKAVGGDNAVVEFPIVSPGTYFIEAKVETGVSCVPWTGSVQVVAPQPASFNVRVVAPEAFGLPVQDSRVALTATGPSPTTLELVPGTSFSMTTYDQQQRPLPAYVRVTSGGSRLSIEGHTARRPMTANLLTPVTYDVLLVPPAAFAPKLLTGTPVVLDHVVMFDAGVVVTGRARDASDRGVANVHIVLKAGVRPSTVGTSDTSGGFQLLTRAGTMSAEINPPPDSGLPNMRVVGPPGIVLHEGSIFLDLTARWAAVPTATLRISVSSVDGTAVVAGANVRVESAGTSVDKTVGQLTVATSGATGPVETVLPAIGNIRAEKMSDATGNAEFRSLPTGSYRVTIFPPAIPAAAANLAIVGASIELPAAGLVHGVRLASKVKLTGILLPTAQTAGVRITAIDEGAPGSSAATTTAGSGGQYELSVDPGRSYRLWAQPLPGQALGRAALGTVVVGAGGGSVGNHTVPRGIAFKGEVISGPVPVGGALIQVFCLGPSPTCLDPDLPVADTVSASDGAFNLMLPDPGVRN